MGIQKTTDLTLTLHEGFWKSSQQPHLPEPLQMDSPWKGKKKFLRALEKIEANARQVRYRGWSTCRICGCKNGSSEYSKTMNGVTFVWPSGFSHYVEAHNVRPSLAFQEFILGQSFV